MSLGALLLPVTGHHADGAAFEVAYEIATAFGSHLSAVCLRPDPVDIVRYVADWSSPVLAGNTLAAVENQAMEDARDAGKSFEEWRLRRGVPLGEGGPGSDGVTVSWEERIGTSAAILRDLARFANLVVMRGLGPEGPVDGDAMLEAVLFDAGRPVLLTPGTLPAGQLFDTALLGWAGGREEMRAITVALPILRKMNAVEVRAVGHGDDSNVDGLIRYLARNGVTANAARIEPGERSVAEALQAEARRIHASFMVMGGYHHSRAREAVFGGTTRQIITHVEIPVLLAH
jgi:nucleotide-binding universal stress UspA family protein